MSSLTCEILGGTLMAAGVLMLYCWLNNKSKWFDSDNFDQQGAPRRDSLFWVTYLLYFLAMVIAPLLGGAMMIVYGLSE